MIGWLEAAWNRQSADAAAGGVGVNDVAVNNGGEGQMSTSTDEVDAPVGAPQQVKQGPRAGSILAVAVATVVLAMSGSFAVATVVAPQGPQGEQGVQGVQGVQGTPGVRGLRGTTGKRGRTGKSGAAGANGVNGATVIRDRACSNDIAVPLPYC